jgi:hypothetical protein
MSHDHVTPVAEDAAARMPFMQRVLDNPFLLLFLGVVIPTVIYILWGVMEIANIQLIELVK